MQWFFYFSLFRQWHLLFCTRHTATRWRTPEAQNIYDNNVSNLIDKNDAQANAMLKLVCLALSQMPKELQEDFVWANNRKYNDEAVPSIFVQYENRLRTFDDLYALWKKINDFNYAFAQFKTKIDALPCINNPAIECNDVAARKDLIEFVQQKFVDDYFVGNLLNPAGVLPTGKTLLEGPFKLLSLNQRVALFKLMTTGSMGGSWTAGGNKGPEDITMMAIVTTPEKDKPNLLSAIGEKSIIKMLKGMDGFNAWQLVVVDAFLNKILEKSFKYTNIPDDLVTLTPVKKEFLIEFDKADKKTYTFTDNDTKINFYFYYTDDTGTDVYLDQTYSPFDIVTVKFLDHTTIGGINYLKGQSYKMSALGFCVLLNTKYEDRIKEAAKIGLETVALLTFAGEVRAAIEAGKWLTAAAYAADIGITLGDNIMEAKLKDPDWLAISENKEFAEKYLDCSTAWFLFRTPYWVGDALTSLGKAKLLADDAKNVKAALLALSEDINLATEGLKARVLASIALEEKGSFIFKLTDNEIKTIILHAKNIGVDLLETENIIFNASRVSKQFTAIEVEQQIGWWQIVKNRGYPYLFNSKPDFEKLGTIIKDLAKEWGLPEKNIYMQGSCLRINSTGELVGGVIGDLDVAIKVDEATFDKLVNRFKSVVSSDKVLKRIGNNGKIGALDMFKTSNVSEKSLGVQFYEKFETKYGTTLQNKFGVPKIQISIIKEGGALDISPFLKF